MKKISHILSYESPYKGDMTLYRNIMKRISISGVQPKYSLKIDNNILVLTEKGGEYILKPVTVGPFKNLEQMPANEHLTMQIAKQIFQINVASNAILLFKDGTPAYLTRRFDVGPNGIKFHQEDFAQLAQITEETNGSNYKYNLSYEEIGNLLKKYVVTYKFEIEKFFLMVLFNYIFSNGDAHLKNFSIIQTLQGDYILSPAYDLLCTQLHLPEDNNLALHLFKDGWSTNYLNFGYYILDDFYSFGRRLEIPEKRIDKLIQQFRDKIRFTDDLIDVSFLTTDMKRKYQELYRQKVLQLFIDY